MGFPKDASSVNDISISLWQGAWIAGGVVGVITLVLLLWPAVFHRASASKGEFPKQTQYNIPVEILYTVIPFIIVFVLFYFTAIKQNEIVDKASSGHGNLVIQRQERRQSLLERQRSHQLCIFHKARKFASL
jgi:cytochrome c oxidase subunit 2